MNIDIIISVEVLVFLLCVAYLLYKYSEKSVPFYVKISVYITWILCFSIIILLPLDIYYVIFNYYTYILLYYKLYFKKIIYYFSINCTIKYKFYNLLYFHFLCHFRNKFF